MRAKGLPQKDHFDLNGLKYQPVPPYGGFHADSDAQFLQTLRVFGFIARKYQ